MRAIADYWARLDGVEKPFLAFLLFTQVYYFYRYAFRLQSELAPPGYEPTPEAYQYPKYFVAALMLGVLALIFLRNKETAAHVLDRFRREPIWLLIIAFALYCGLTAFRFGLDPSDFSHVAKFVFVIPFALVAAIIWRKKSLLPFLFLFVGASLVYHVAYEVVMFAHFEATGRWPALTFSQLVPRYGAGWDDPNGFAAFAVLSVVGVLFLKPDDARLRSAQRALVFVLTLMAVLTYSMTAAVGLAVGVALLFLVRRLDVAKVAAMAAACGIVAAALLASGHIDIIIEGKLKSIEAHTRTKVADPTATVVIQEPRPPTPTPGPVPPVSGQQQRPPDETSQPGGQSPTTGATTAATADGSSVASDIGRFLVGETDHFHFHETLFLLFYLNFGVLGLGLFLAGQTLTLRRAWLGWRGGGAHSEGYLLGAILLIAFLVMNCFLPLYAIFPINLYMWLVVGLIWARPLAEAAVVPTAELSAGAPVPNPAHAQS